MGVILRIVVLLFAVWLLSLIVRSALRRMRAAGERERAARARAQVTQMVPCARCGVHVPLTQAVTRDGRHYCSSEHARAE